MGKDRHRATGHFFGLPYGLGYWVLFCAAFRGGFGANVVSHTDICRRSIGWAINCPQQNSRYLTGTEIVPRTLVVPACELIFIYRKRLSPNFGSV